MSNGEYVYEILLVEDNPGDIRLTQEAMKESKFKNNLSIATDGVEAMEFLKKQGKYKDTPIPDLVLLDLNLPKMDGREVLEQMKSIDEFKKIPVVILTTSNAEKDIAKSYELHANCYINKPVDLEQFFEVVRTIENYWFNIVKLPSKTINPV